MSWALPYNLAVVDAGGNLISHVRMDGAWLGSIDISIHKAWTARAFDMATAGSGEDGAVGQAAVRHQQHQPRQGGHLRGRHAG